MNKNKNNNGRIYLERRIIRVRRIIRLGKYGILNQTN